MRRLHLTLGRAVRPCAAFALLALACKHDAGSDDGTTGDASTSGDGGSSTAASSSDGSSSSGADTSGGSSGSTGEVDLPDPLPPLDGIVLTTESRRVPVHAIAAMQENDPREPAMLDQMIADGYGDEQDADGEAIIDVTLDGSAAPTPGPAAARITRFVHMADTQLADDESPTRLASFDSPGATAGAFRPQEAYGCQMVNAAVRTINAVNAADPIDFVIMGGDNADSAQSNEVQWFLSVLDGDDVVECDSAIDDDPVPGEGNDPKDPFAPVGLDVPWYWVMGNHDVLVQGNFPIEGRQDDVVGEDVDGATRDWSMPGGPLTMGPIPADDERALVDGAGLLGLVMASSDGHGVTEAVVSSGKANYTFDVAGTDIRFVVLDTAAQTGGSEGVVRQAEVDAFLQPALDAAVDDGKFVFIATHHASTSLGDGSGLGGMVIDDALTTDEFQALLGEYDNILAHLCGHSHVHRVTVVEPLGGTPYWEVITSAIADHPHQMRVLDVNDEDNGFISLTSVAFDIAFDGDPLAAEGRLRGITDLTSGWQHTGEGVPEDRNVRLWFPLPG